MKEYRISCGEIIGHVTTTDTGIIVKLPTVWGQFMWQEVFKLVGWLTHTFGSCTQEEVSQQSQTNQKQEKNKT